MRLVSRMNRARRLARMPERSAGFGPVSDKTAYQDLYDLRWGGSLVDYFRYADQPGLIQRTHVK